MLERGGAAHDGGVLRPGRAEERGSPQAGYGLKKDREKWITPIELFQHGQRAEKVARAPE